VLVGFALGCGGQAAQEDVEATSMAYLAVSASSGYSADDSAASAERVPRDLDGHAR
jgi:hypothetical protein